MDVTGERVRLRAMRPGDADALWAWNHDPDVMRWMDAGYPQTPERVREWLEQRPRNDYGDVLFGVETLAGATLAGLVRLHGAEPGTGIAELDVYLGREHQGRGLGTDAVRTACRYGFDAMRLHRITLTVVAGNAAARHVYGRLGFVEEGRLRQVFRRDGRWHDKYVMGLLAGELR